MTTCLVCPIGNEELVINEFLLKIKDCITDFHFIGVFDDYSKDRSRLIFNSFAIADNRYEMLDIGKSKGLALVYLAGLRYAAQCGYQKIIELDVGHHVEVIPEMVELLNIYEVVFASRFIKNDNFDSNVKLKRKVLSKLGTYIGRYFLNMPFTDCTSGLQGFSNKTLEKLPWDQFISKGHIYQTEMKYYCRNLSFKEIPIRYCNSETSLRMNSILEAVSVAIRLFFRSKYCLNSIFENDFASSDKQKILRKIQMIKSLCGRLPNSTLKNNFALFLEDIEFYIMFGNLR